MKPLNIVRFACAGLIIPLLLAGCSTTISPSDPIGNPGIVPISSKSSTLTVPVSIKLTDVATIVNQLAPPGFSGTWHNHAQAKRPVVRIVWHGLHSHPEVHWESFGPVIEVPPHVDYGVDRGTIALSGQGDRVSINVPVKAHAREEPGGATASADGTATGSSTLTVKPDYNINPSVDVSVNISRAVINLPLLNKINFSGFANDQAKNAINNIKGSLNDKVSKAVNLRKIAQKAWDGLPGCVLIPGTKDIWVRVAPEAVMLDGPHAANNVVTGTFALQAKVETLLQSSQPSSPQRIPLPNLISLPNDRMFHISLPVKVEMNELNRTLSPLLKGNDKGSIKLDKDESVILKSAMLFPRGNQLFVKVGFVGDHGRWLHKVKGTLIFVATPSLDLSKKILSFKDIDFTADTRSTLKGAGEEYAALLLKPIIIYELQKRLKVDLTPQLGKAISSANTLADKIKLPPPIVLNFKLEHLDAQAIAVYGDTLYFNFDASGTTDVTF